MAAYCQVYGVVIHFTSPAGWLPVHRDQLRAQRSVTSMGKLYLLPTLYEIWVSYNVFHSYLSGNVTIWRDFVNYKEPRGATSHWESANGHLL